MCVCVCVCARARAARVILTFRVDLIYFFPNTFAFPSDTTIRPWLLTKRRLAILGICQSVSQYQPINQYETNQSLLATRVLTSLQSQTQPRETPPSQNCVLTSLQSPTQPLSQNCEVLPRAAFLFTL